MSKAYEIYTDALRDHFKIYYANWPPGEPIELGDFGMMDGNIFIPEGNISKDLNIQFETRNDKTEDVYEFKSDNSIEIKFIPKGSFIAPQIPSIKASMEIKFSHPRSVYFVASGITHHSIFPSNEIGAIILGMFKEQKWPKNRLVITKLVQAATSTIIISGKSGAIVGLEAESDAIPNIDLADASIKLGLTIDNGTEFKIISADGLYPLFGLSGIKPKHWLLPNSSDIWQPRSRNVYLNIDYITRNIDNNRLTFDDLYFGDI